MADSGAPREPTNVTTEALDHLLHSIWLYIDWRCVTKNLTTGQREMWLAAVDRCRAQDHGDDFEPLSVEWRWWA